MSRSVSADSGPLYDDGIITGQIVDKEGVGIQGVSIYLENVDDYQFWGNFWGESDADGNFTIEEVTRGRYRARIDDYPNRYAGKYAGGGLQASSATILDVENSQAIVVNETLEVGATITGLVSAPAHVKYFRPTVSAYYYDTALGFWIAVDTFYDRVDGNYVLSGLPAGEFVIGASEYFDNDQQETFFPDAVSKEEATAVRVKTGERLSGVDFSITTEKAMSGGAIKGRVVSAETGAPLVNIAVNLHTHGIQHDPWIHSVNYASTDANGEYEFHNLQADNYRVAFSDFREIYATEYNGNMPTLGGAPLIPVDLNSDLTVDAALERGAKVSLSFSSTTGRRMTSSYVTAFRWNQHDAWLLVGGDYSDYGPVTVTGLQTGEYKFQVTADFGWNYGFSEWYGGAETIEAAEIVQIKAGTDVTLDPVVFGENTGVIEGRVTGPDDTPVANAYVDITNTDVDARYFDLNLKTDANGMFRSPPLPVGDYSLRVNPVEKGLLMVWYGNVTDSEDAKTIQVEQGDVISADVKIEYAATISGKVTTPSNFSADIVTAKAYRLVDGEWQSAGYAEVKKDKTYSIGRLAADDYLVYFSALKYQPYPRAPFEFGEWHGDVASRNDAVKISLTTGERVTEIDAQLGNIIGSQSRRDGVISGNVASANWQSPDGFEVRAYIETSAYRGPKYWAYETTVPVDAEGNYVLDSLPHGRYIIGFYDATGQHKPEYYNNVADIESAIVLMISAETPSISGINAILQLSQSRVK